MLPAHSAGLSRHLALNHPPCARKGAPKETESTAFSCMGFHKHRGLKKKSIESSVMRRRIHDGERNKTEDTGG